MTTNLLLAESLRHALGEAMMALDNAEATGEPALLSLAFARVSRCHREAGALPEADGCARRGLQFARRLGAVDASVDALCELAELACERGQRLEAQDGPHAARCLGEAARDHAIEAAMLAQHSADPQWEITVLLRVSDLLDRLGDHDDAIALQCRAISLMCGVAAPAVVGVPSAARY